MINRLITHQKLQPKVKSQNAWPIYQLHLLSEMMDLSRRKLGEDTSQLY